MPLDDVSTPELTRSLVDASAEAGRQVGALVHRSGQVEWVVVGDAGKLMLPELGRLRAAQGRFRGLRLIHTHVRGEALTRDDLVDLVKLRLDLVCAILISPQGEARAMHVAYNIPVEQGQLPYREIGPLPLGQLHLDVGALMSGLEAEFARMFKAREVRGKDGRAILVHVAQKSTDAARRAEESMRELRELARTAGVEVVDTVIQLRDKVDPKFVLGKGRLDELLVRALQLDAEVLVFDRELSPAQGSAIGKQSDLKVLDRAQLILDIFAQRAQSSDGKLQVELAQLKYNMPRLSQKDDALSRLTGGIGGRGPGETKLEIGRRRAKERVTQLEQRLKTLAKRREQLRHRRTRSDVPSVAIVGYTNAGKSTLLNALTGAAVHTENQLFATLETRSRVLSRRLLPPTFTQGTPLSPEEAPSGDADVDESDYAEFRDPRAGRQGDIVFTDTVGFIRHLPKDLFAAFRATFEEACAADLLLHVVDASDEARAEHIKTTEEVLAKLDVADMPRLIVFNKIELLDPFARGVLRSRFPDAVLVSALDPSTLTPLVAHIISAIAALSEQNISLLADSH